MSETVHLTETGFNAGKRLCSSTDVEGTRNVHAAYAPLHKEQFRAVVCANCLITWAREAYQDGDDIPSYIETLRSAPPSVQF
jgi:hypothetical protein